MENDVVYINRNGRIATLYPRKNQKNPIGLLIKQKAIQKKQHVTKHNKHEKDHIHCFIQ